MRISPVRFSVTKKPFLSSVSRQSFSLTRPRPRPRNCLSGLTVPPKRELLPAAGRDDQYLLAVDLLEATAGEQALAVREHASEPV
jgi:hypothetical protein